MFSRYLGQSLGAAIFGAIFNAVLAERLRAAPAALQGRLPRQVNGIGSALARSGQLGQAATSYVRAAIAAATHDVYLGLAAVAVATGVTVLVIVPRRFATSENRATSPGAVSSAGD